MKILFKTKVRLNKQEIRIDKKITSHPRGSYRGNHQYINTGHHESYMTEETISLDDDEAEIISILQELADLGYGGQYNPSYMETSDMKSLSWSDSSVLATFDTDIAFTIHDNHISAFYADFSELSLDVYEHLKDNLASLNKIKELFLIFSEEQDAFDVSSLGELEYLQLARSRGVIQLPEFSKLPNLGVLVVRGIVESIDSSLQELKYLQRLVMRTTKLPSIPAYIGNLPALIWLEFGEVFTEIPSEIMKLSNLIVLDLISEEIEELPENFGSFERLAHLNLEMQKLKSLPDSFADLKVLSDLYLWNLPITTLPPFITKLNNLRYLWVKENSRLRGLLEEIPEDIGELVELRGLELNGHEITSIPASIAKLTKLEELNLGINDIETIPSEIGSLTNLTKLELYSNQFVSLPDEITELSKLTYLDLSNSPLQQLPTNIGNLQQLTEFDALDCPLKTLPDSLQTISYEQFRFFLVSLEEGLDSLNEPLQQWVSSLAEYAANNEELGIELQVSKYEKETEE